MRGFTLIELILVMAILGILAVAGFEAYFTAMTKSRDTQRKNDLNQIAKALELFNNDVGRYPKVDADGKMTCPTYDEEDGVVEADCGTSISAYISGATATYMAKVPSDSNTIQVYTYVPDASFGSYALYAALENTQDKDWKSGGGNWGKSCSTSGIINCNYKLTETGVVR